MEGNQQKMREALLALSAWVKIVKDHPKDKTATECAEFVEQAVNAALSAPPRNCDVGTAEEQLLRFVASIESLNCDSEDIRCAFYALRWAQMPYAAQEGSAE